MKLHSKELISGLSEFYKTYQGLGGNGQAQEYYEIVQKLQIHDD